ncbi:hypothetical protein Dda_6758 [Drechslerella dactyloides]|uniref:Uncharacterized protein n=1 Tax=Drechslerella dactyloides TaxID=74499 RepID=A0AAD6IU45_DREDA|nr:hypothetical protein Dda_6758 [Drechslerella dactyloides]
MSSNAQRPPNAQSANNAPIDWNGHSISKVFANDMNVRRILKYIKDPKDVFSLLNVNRPVRDGILNCRLHWGRFRRLIINRKFLPTHYPSQNKVFYDPELERYKRKMIESGEWPKHKYFERFGDFAFEEFIINKIMRMPYWFSPAMDSDYWDQIWEQKRFITTLVLDHTAVTGRGLFGSVAMPTGNDIYRTSSGLISYLMPHLKHLSLRYCPNVQHSDIAIYLILPPTSYLGPRELLTLRAYGCGEAPTEGPFQNLPGFGSKNKITQKSDNILNIKILALLFPSCLSIAHHKRHTLPHTVLGTDPRDTQRLIRAQENRLETLHRVGWLSMAVLQIFPPPLTLPDPLTGQPVSGPFGGFLASVHESIMLASICIYSNIKLDWKPFCVNRHDCASFKIENFTPVARINHRTGRTTGLGNLYGALAGRHVRRQDYHDFTDGVVPRIPVQLSNLIPGKEGMYIQYRAEVSKVPTEGENESQRERPAFLSMQGHRPAPDYYDPGITGSKFITDHGAPMFTDREKLCTCQDCFERQLAWSKTELERINTWKFAGVNILQREHAAVKAAEIAYRRQKYKHLPPTELETREKLKALAAAQNNKLPGGKGPRIVELGSDDDMGDASDAASDESECDPETTGANHPILKKMDNLYDDLIKEVRAGGVIPQGMTELVRSIRNARHHIERSKIAEVEHKERRMRAKGLHKRVRSAEKDMDPRCDYSPETYFGPKRLYKDMVLTDTTGNPLPNSAYETEFTWIPTTMDMLAFEHKINTPEGKYWMSDTEMCRGDIAGCDFIWENWEYGDWFRPREAAIKAGRHKEIMWQATHVPKGFEVRKPKDGAKLKRKAEDPLAEIAEEWRENTNSGRRVRERAPEGEQTKKEEKTDKKGDKTDKKGEKTGKNDRKSAQQKEEKAAKAGGKSGGHLAEKTRQTVNAEKERYIRNQIHRLDAAFHEMEINGAAITQDETAKDPDTDRTVRFIKPIGRKWTKLGRDRDAREMETGKKAPPIAPQPPTKSALKKLKKEVKEAMKPVTRVIENDVKPLIAEAVYAGRNMGVDTASLVASTSAAATTKAGAYIPCVAPTVARGTAVRLGIARGRKPPVRARSNVPRTLDWEYQDERIADDDERGYIQ